MSLTYFKRFRMEVDLRGRRMAFPEPPPGYRLVAWSPELLADHADTKYRCFCHEIDAVVFECLSQPQGCHRLMGEIADKDGFLPEATWLLKYVGAGLAHAEYCGTIQGVRATSRHGGIQNVGVTPEHRRYGLATVLVSAALAGFQQVGLAKAYLEVTAQNEGAVRLYKQLGFRRTKTLYKAVELAYTESAG